ncbi:hypothetical protein VNO77_24585 [Canavalia gladiata]|uniref:Uncharacterized protein n=1 Tax=Canavalia gladiata TaxID=3824 RepID=A0AAN9L7A1_CANGL
MGLAISFDCECIYQNIIYGLNGRRVTTACDITVASRFVLQSQTEFTESPCLWKSVAPKFGESLTPCIKSIFSEAESLCFRNSRKQNLPWNYLTNCRSHVDMYTLLAPCSYVPIKYPSPAPINTPS